MSHTMASASTTIAILAIFLVVQPWTATSNILSPILDDVCKGVECGKGTCKPSRNSTFFFVCECDPGWKKTHHDNDLMFLPCVIPNCSLDYSCTKAASSVKDRGSRANKSLFDPCHWSDCGGGTCIKTSPFTHTCKCREGYYNLLSTASFPCFPECALGVDCSSLGITVQNKSTSSASNLFDNGTNHASSITRGSLNLLIIVTMVLAPILWKLN